MQKIGVRIGTVWERTTEVIAGRIGILATVAFLFLFLPGVVQGGAALAAPAAGGLQSAVQLAASLLAIVGVLALTAVASDPATTQGDAIGIGARRLAPAMGLLLVVIVAIVLLSIPGAFLMASSGFDFRRAQAGLAQGAIDAGRFGGAAIYFLVLSAALLWLSARLVPLFAIIVNERRGIGAFARSMALTHGATLRLIGVLILYAIVFLVVFAAATSVIGLAFRLLLGAEGTATAGFLAALAGSVVSAGFSVVQSVFSAQYYLAARDTADGA